MSDSENIPSSTETNALNWIINNKTFIEASLKNFPRGALTDFYEIIREYNDGREEDSMSEEVHFFLVAIRADKRLGRELFSNYLSKAIKRFASEDDKIDWFDGTEMPKFYQQYLVSGDRPEELKDLVQRIGIINKRFSELYERVNGG